MTDFKPSALVMKLRSAALLREEQDDIFDLLVEAADDIESREHSFDLRWDADMRAIKRWQAEKPGRDLTWPDHADLCVWLLDKLERAKDEATP